MKSIQYDQYIPESKSILDGNSGLFINGSDFFELQGHLSLPSQYLIIDGLILDNRSTFRNSNYDQIDNPSSTEDKKFQDFSKSEKRPRDPVERDYFPPSQLSHSIFSDNNMWNKSQDFNESENISNDPKESYSFTFDQILDSVFTENGTKAQQDFPQQNFSYSDEHPIGTKQKIIPEIYERIKTDFTKFGSFVIERTIDNQGSTFRVCAKCVRKLLLLHTVLMQIHEESTVLEVSLHTMMRKQHYKKGLTIYVKIKDKEDTLRVMKIAGQYELDISLVSNSSVFPKRINDIFRSNKIASKEKNNIASPPEKKEIVAPKFKKSTSHKENKIHIVYKVDSELTVFDTDDNADESLLLPRRPMTKKKSSIMTVMFPATGHVANLNVEGVNDRELFNVDVPHLDLESLIILKEIVSQNLNQFIQYDHDYKTHKKNNC